jgi:subtilisin
MATRQTAGAVPARACSRRMVYLIALGSLPLVSACERMMPTDPVAATASPRSLVAADVNVLIGFDSPPGVAQLALIESLGGRVSQRYKYIPVVAATIPAASRDIIAAGAGVAYVEDDRQLELYGGKQIMDYGVSKIEAPGAWALGFAGQNVKVGIFDSGIDLEHPDLVVAGGVDLIGDGNGFDDCLGHGTHVAGIVGAANNGNHTVGVAPRAQLYAMRFFDCAGGGATQSREIAGIEWAIDNGMDVINMSFGCCTVVAQGQRIHVPLSNAAEEAAMTAAYAHGIVLIAASGNSSQIQGNSVNQPEVAYPAGYASVVAVGATDDQDMLARFSQWGSDQELTAPGEANLSSFLVGMGTASTLTVESDGERELESIPLAFAGFTRKQGMTAAAVFAGLGTPQEFATVNCAGKIAVVSRGGASGVFGSFADKTRAAQDAGCSGIVIHNNQPGNFAGTLGTATDTARGGRAWIPGVSVSLEEGVYLDNEIRSRPTTLTMINNVGNLMALSGTSMASPHATGVAALVLSKNPNLTPDQVRQVLRASANDLGTPGWDPLFGYGRVNAKRAVQQTP